MAYKAIKEIGGYMIGDIVPDDKAQTWLKMYDVPHVEKIPDIDVPKPIEAKPVSSPLDLNKDGKVDKQDASIAGKVMRNFNRRK